ncbi:ATP-binding protein [Limnofasciculus baicalensis]|uniref:ATP-binding protein n=1 Tax=Limnofasciculus baicalensis BBK-W-15 TaxID=2699891 RepID=A0AAE3KL39_9CYAN|nr:ATP-binding protein [Limnofasciculus baicalensis]MCP2727679.1 ATP-binding protein [Limnofasciculus baicalensis BBK-W-15]
MAQYPEIDYRHVLSELSVNRKDPCEIIRELISNSYDAQASRIEIFPLLKDKGFIYFDDGTGLSETVETNGITPYRAFFSIGRSTKIQGELIGYKCQGSKLCFASKRITLITRCSQDENWRSISIDNPKDNLTQQYDIQSQLDNSPWQTLRNLFSRPNKQTVNILDHLSEEFFTNSFSRGAMIVVQGIEVEKFSDYYDSADDGSRKWSYLKHYIRFNTRHGDIRCLRSKETGFSEAKFESFKQSPGYNDQCELYLWTQDNLKKIETGYPYLEKPDDLDKSQIKSPAQISRLNDGRFSARGAMNFQFEDVNYCLVIAIDGNRRALDKYQELGRRGDKRSGIRLTDQRGTFICSEGIKICNYNEIFDHSKLEDYSVLNTPNAQSHYIFMINGSFDVVTNRNSLTEAALRILQDDSFVYNIKRFFDAAMNQTSVFRELIERLNKENHDAKLEGYTKKLNKLKEEIQDRSRFQVEDIEQLKGKWLVEPSIGEEHWVGALYTMFAHLVTPDSNYAHLWLSPRTFSGMGIDSIAVSIGENSLATNVHKALEYKYNLSPSDEFNHPLILTDQIVCWEMPTPQEGDQIKDSYNYYGYISLPEELHGIGYEIIKIQSRTAEFHGGNIKVISLKALLNKTFNCQWKTPPPKVGDTQKKKGGKKSK